MVIAICVPTIAALHAAIPELISYQGRLTDASGNPVADDIYQIRFSIYDSDVGGPSLWSSGFRSISTENGLYSYLLGSNADLPIFIFNDNDELWLGITVGADPEQTPRQRITANAFSYKAARADVAGSFDGELIVGDSTMIADGTGIRIGTDSAPTESYLVGIQRNYDETSPENRRGIELAITNEGDGPLYGINSSAENTTPGQGSVASGVRGFGTTDGTAYGIYGEGDQHSPGISTGSSYGAFARGSSGFTAYGVRGTAENAVIGYGVYGSATNNGTNWSGYFSGNVNVTGNLSKGGGAFRIDHPLDPENQYLQHSFVESPDMKNIYDGIVALDVNGEASVTMPDWFDALNRDFRYQLTPIGAAMPELHIASEISGRSFSIAGGAPNTKVSWMVTGIRHDPWANRNRIEVELGKAPYEAGYYAHPESYGLPRERGIDWKNAHDPATVSEPN
jgi:hypothetical protein